LARIASLYSGIAVKVVAGTALDDALAKEREASIDLRNGYGVGLRNRRVPSENYASQPHSTVQDSEGSASEAQLDTVAAEDEWAEVAHFRAELEALRLRMIDACRYGYVCAVEAPRALVMNRESSAAATLQQTDCGSIVRGVQDEVASAVRLLASSQSGRRSR
jgi:hypothetical protein